MKKKLVLNYQENIDFLNSKIYLNNINYWQKFWLDHNIVNEFTIPTEYFAKILNLLSLAKAVNVLDLACGNGDKTIELVKHNFKVTGIDISELAIGQALTLGQQLDLEVDFDCSDILDMPYAYASFDAVIAFFILEHLTFNLAKHLVQQLKSIIMPGGYFITAIRQNYPNLENSQVLEDKTLVSGDNLTKGMFYFQYTNSYINELFQNWQIHEQIAINNDVMLIIAKNFQP